MICIIDCGSSWIKDIKKNLDIFGYPYKIVKLKEIKKTNFESFSGIIISGAPILLTQLGPKWYKDQFKFIKKVDVPVLGICFGHQIIGLVYGSSISIKEMTDKKERIEIIKQEGILSGIKNGSLFRESHCEFITLPKDFKLLARSKSCSNESMMYKSRRLYGTQFHPEVSGDNGRIILRNFLYMC